MLRRIKKIEKEEERKLSNLTPKYDKKHSRWTLKYREPAPRLVKLIEHSGVYINADKLAEIKALANDCRSLSQMLHMTTISNLNNDGTNVKPGLDEHAMIILLKFVAENGIRIGM